jgi:hypothetical protein
MGPRGWCVRFAVLCLKLPARQKPSRQQMFRARPVQRQRCSTRLFGTKETLATVLPSCSLLVLSAAPRKSRVALTVGFKLEHMLRLFSPLADA